MDEPRSIIQESSIPKQYKPLMLELLDKFGFHWHIELDTCEERLGTGSARLEVNLFDFADNPTQVELQASINSLMEKIEEYRTIHGTPEEDPLQGFKDFVENIEFLDWEYDRANLHSHRLEILENWRDERIDYYRSVQKQKLAEAREHALKESESIDIGGDELVCRTCGVFFFDNFDKHFGAKYLYCSITCEANAELQCVQCGIEYRVGRGIARERLLKLEGFCSPRCNADFKSDREADTRYVSAMRRKASQFSAEFEESITRREVFKKGGGKCYICNNATHFETLDEYSPLLATVDHVIPWTKGGAHNWNNVKLCCLRCNLIKGNRET